MHIRKANASDSGTIARLTGQLGYAADAETIRCSLGKIVDHPDHLVLVAEVNNEVVGWLQAHASVVLESGFRVEITGLVVSESSRRMGIGRSLVEKAEGWAAEKGAPVLVVRSNTKRQESHRFYPSLGFEVSKTQTVYRKQVR